MAKYIDALSGEVLKDEEEIKLIVRYIMDGGLFYLQKTVGDLRPNCVYVTAPVDVPSFLLRDGAVKINYDNSVTCFSLNGALSRKLPVFINWEALLTKRAQCHVPGIYSAWPQRAGILMREGRCYEIPPLVRASVMVSALPAWVTTARNKTAIRRNGDVYEFESAGKIQTGAIGKALWVEYDGAGIVDILKLSDPAAAEYHIRWYGGELGILPEVLARYAGKD